jgi:hypothetical protein
MQIDATNWATVKSPTNDYVIVQAALNFTNDWILTNAAKTIQWTGGEAVAGNPLQRRVTKTNSVETTVTASIGSSTNSLNVWVVWSTVQIFTNGTNPSPLSFSIGGDFPDNQLGIETNSDQDEAAGKICAVATITPTGAYTVVSNGWAFPQYIMIHSFENGISNTLKWSDTWTDDATATTTNLDNQNKLYLIDAPNIGPIGGTNYEKYMNEMDYVTVNLGSGEQTCSATNNFWYWQGRWNELQYPPPFITYTALGIGTNTLPSTAFY